MFQRSLFYFVLAIMTVACGGGGGGGSKGGSGDPFSADNYTNTKVYRADSPYSSVLKDCTLAESSEQSCSLTDLPLLVEESGSPTVNQILDRLIVSHDWMGRRFKETLSTYPNDILRLFSSITTIVIDDDIRPAYYVAETSTMYIDPAYLWQTNAEKATINQREDYRNDFGDALEFVSLARFVDGFNWAWDSYALDDKLERDVDDLRLSFARLLLHELMHANDSFPPAEASLLNQNQTLYQAMQSLQGVRISDELMDTMPLNSGLMYGLADVMYAGNTATNAQKSLTAAEVGDVMESDGASDDYAYTSQYEDVAMLFSEVMMKYLFDLDRDVAYSNRPGDDAYCDDYIVAWGVRGRIGDVNVKDRAQFVVESVYLGEDFSLFFQNLAAPKALRQDESWCDNLAVF